MEKNLFISQENIKELLKWRCDSGILSVYLDVEERDRKAGQKWKTLVHSELYKLTAQYPDDRVLHKTIEETTNDLLEIPMEMRKRSLIYFRNSSTGNVFMRSVQVPIKTQCVWLNTVFLRPLVAMMDGSPLLGIVILSKDLARILTWRQGMILESEEKQIELETGFDEEVSPGMGNLGSQIDRFAQKMEVQVRKNLTAVATEVAKFGDETKWQSLMLIGSPRFTEIVEENLPTRWQDRITGILDKNYIKATHNQIASSITELLRDWKKNVEESLVKTVIDAAGPGGRAVTGVQKTIDALEQYRVDHLMFSSDLQITGHRDETGALLVDLTEEESEGLEEERYVIERMIELAYDSGARVTPLEGKSSELLKSFGGVASLLRY